MVGVFRAFLADPQFGVKAARGEGDRIRPCIGANHCLRRTQLPGGEIGCIHNPEAGREKEWGDGTLVRVSRKKTVLVVGGGPAGLEAALTAAKRGHEVHLFEADAELGGQLKAAHQLPGRTEIFGVITHRDMEARRLGVELHLGQPISASEILARDPDAVIVATGSRFSLTGTYHWSRSGDRIPGASEVSGVYSLSQALSDGLSNLGSKVVIVDELGDIQALCLADALSTAGASVVMVTPFPIAGAMLEPISQGFLLAKVFRAGTVVQAYSVIEEVMPGRVRIRHLLSDSRHEDDFSSLVLILPHKAETDLYNELKDSSKEVHLVGDAVAPRGIESAILEAHRASRLL